MTSPGVVTLVRGAGTSAPNRAVLPWRPSARLVQAAVFVVAVAARLAVILRHGGLHGNFGYDAGVYFAAGDALGHGRLPYRDFVLIHPPGVMLILTPFAAMARLTSDERAFTATVLAFTLLGGVNAALVVRVARRLGMRMRGAVAAGLFYAFWYGSIDSEYLIKLEPVGNLLLLLGLLAALRCHRDGPLRWAVAAGVGLGATLTIKIWWVVPFAIAVGWLAWRTRSGRQLGAVLAGAALVNLAVDGPFFLASPHAMWTSVVDDQVGRPAVSRSPLTRLTDLSTVNRLTGAMSTTDEWVVSLVLVAVTCWVIRRSWQMRAVRPMILVLVAQSLVLLLAPSWFSYYCDFLAVPAAITVGAAALRRPGAARFGVRSGWVVVAAVTAISVPALAIGRFAVQPFHGAAALARATSNVRCVLSDSPMGLIELNALSRSFANGCENWVDVTGRTYGADRSSTPRIGNTRWQRDLTAYLRSGDAVIIVRGHGTGISPATSRAIRRDGVLARAGRHTVYRVGG